MLPVLQIRGDCSSASKAEVELTRRRTLAALAASLALTLCSTTQSASAWAESNLDAAASFMTKVSAELAAIVGGDLSKAQKQQKLESLIDRTVAVDDIARFCLGRFWREATPSQRRAYLQLFHSVLVTQVVLRLGDYHQEEVQIIVGRPEDDGGDTDVPSTLRRTGNPPAQVTWVLQPDRESFKIIDLLAEGVSMRLTVRSDYDSFITSHGDEIEVLLSALRRQNQQNQS
jgi:phospholipid transport system substrate-binding protein